MKLIKYYLFLLLITPFMSVAQQNLTFEHDGIIREYIYYQPENLNTNAPLVFVFHGYSGSSEEVMNFSNMNTVANENGFAVCYPQGTTDINFNTFFNVGYTDQDNPTVDDVDFVVQLANFLQNSYQLNNEKTFCTGFSNGGDFCYLLACEASTVFRAVAPVAGTMLTDMFNNCSPENPIPIFETHGTADPVTFYNGDSENIGGWGTYVSIPTIIDFWTNANNVSDITIDTLPDIFANDGTYIIREIHSSPNTINEVWHYKVLEGGHDWVGSFGNMDIDISQEIWAFFNLMSEDTSSSIEGTNIINSSRKLIKIVNILGQEVTEQPNTILYYIFNDNTVEKRMILK